MKIPRWFPSAVFAAGLLSAGAQTSFKFTFGPQPEPGYALVSPADFYSAATGYGFEPEADADGTNAASSGRAFFFSVRVPEGNYAVTVLLGDPAAASVTTVKAEQRRLMLENVRLAPDRLAARTFIVNVRTPRISASKKVRLKPRELKTETVDWDDKLTLEFTGAHPALRELVIAPTNVPTVFIAGDSTVCDQPAAPWNSWGQMLPRFFQPDVAVANYAESGETLRSSLAAGRFDKIFSLMKAGDYLFVQFGHNDMKEKSPNALAGYKAHLEQIVARTRDAGGIPVLVTSMERKAGVQHDTLMGYPQTVRDVARAQHCALIDLNAMSKVFYQSLGAGLDQAFVDGTHHDNYGSYELAKCVVAGIRRDALPLAKSIVDDFGDFDPAHPDPVADFHMSDNPVRSMEKPLGN